MDNLKEKYQKYTVQDWIALVFGAVTMGIQVFRYATNTLADNGLEGVVFCIAFLLLFAPKTIVDLIKKVRGVDTK